MSTRGIGALAALAAAFVLFAAPAAQAATGYQNVGALGAGQGSGPGQFEGPERIAVDHASGDVYIVDAGNDRVQVFDSSGAYLTEIGGFAEPFGIAIDQGAPISLYVSDAGNQRVFKLDSNGAATPSFTLDAAFDSPAAGESATKVGDFHAPLAHDPASGDLFLADPADDQLQRYDGAGGDFVDAYDGTGTPDGPFTGLQDVAVGNGNLYVVDAKGASAAASPSRVLQLDLLGGFEQTLRPLSAEPSGDGLVAVDPNNGNVLVGDVREGFFPTPPFFSEGVHVLDAAGEKIATVDTEQTVTGVAADGASTGQVYVAVDCGCGSNGAAVLAPLTWPEATMLPATDVSHFSATLNAEVNPQGGVNTSAYISYSVDGQNWGGTTPHNGTTDPALEGSTEPVPISNPLKGLKPGTTYYALVTLYTSTGITESDPIEFTTLAAPTPVVTLDPVQPSMPAAAAFSGSVDPEGFPTDYRFEIAVDDGSPDWVAFGRGSAGGDDPVAVGAERELTAGTAYLVRLVAENAGTSAATPPQSFAVASSRPTVRTIPGSGRTTSSVRLNGLINPNGLPTSYRFEWGTSTAYGNVIPSSGGNAYAGQGVAASRFSKPVEGLAPGTTIHYRIVASNAAGETVSGDRSVTTLAEPVGYEMVSPPDKRGSNLFFCCRVQAAADGSRVQFMSAGVFAGGHSNLQLNTYRAVRGADNWETRFLPLPQTTKNGGFTNGGTQGFSPDLSHVFQFSREALTPGAVEDNSNMYRRNIDTGELELVASFDDPGFGMGISDAGIFMGASEDAAHMVFRSPVALRPGDNPGDNIYDFSDGELHLVSVLPDGSPASEVKAGLGPANSSRLRLNMVSDDGSRIWFVANRALYLREEGEPTTLVSGSQRSGDDPAVPRIVDESWASADGSTVYFTSAWPLTDEAPPNPPGVELEKLYRYDAGSGDLDYVEPGGNGPSDTNFVFRILGVSDDGSTVYFTGGYNVVERGQASFVYDRNRLYVAEHGVSRFIAVTDPAKQASIDTGVASPNGRYFALQSPDDTLVEPAAASCPGCTQIFAYDAATEELVCASCNPSGATTSDLPENWIAPEENTGGYVSRVLLDDGSLFFESPDQLVPEDTNDKLDVYRWDAGQIDLISRGFGKEHSFLGDATPDGRSVFFYTGEHLVGQDTDDAQDIYVARVGGGLAGQNPPPPEPPCSGEGCLGRAPDPPADVVAGSNGFLGPADPKPRFGKPRRCGKGKVAKQAKGKRKCVKRRAAKRAAGRQTPGKRTAGKAKGGRK